MSKRDLVVIGASLGGVRALRELAAALPAGFPAAVCVVLHVGAHRSTLPALLSAAGPLPARHAVDGEPLRPGHIHVAPPDHHLLLAEGGRLQLTRGPKEHHTRPAVDPLFRSAALHAGARVIGVILTGALDDGTAGLQMVKACGGTAVVQDPREAEEPGMPQAAVSAVQVDHCVALADLAALLVDLVEQPAQAQQPAPPVPPPARLLHEHLAGLGGDNAMDELSRIAEPSTFVCPDCKGALWEVQGVQPPRFRCHTGHAFSLRTLASVQSQSAEEALWSGLRALQEKEALLRKIAALDRVAGDEAHAQQAEAQAQHIAQQAETLRQLIEQE